MRAAPIAPAFKRPNPTSLGNATYAGCSLYGWLVSPYTAKVRAMLHYKRIRFHDVTPSAAVLQLRIKPAVGRTIMPSVQLADGSWRQDSALVCDEIEAVHAERPTKPPGAAQQLASLLLELHADEWMPMVALHYRWNREDNATWAVTEFGRCGFPWLPTLLSAPLIRPFAAKMQSFRKVQGVGEPTRAGVEAFATGLIAQLEAHFARPGATDYLLGSAPCRGDFALYGPLWAHLFRDPFSRSLFDAAPNVVRWIERLHGHRRDPAFPELPTARPPPDAPAGPSGASFLPRDEVPSTLDPLFGTVFAEQWPFLATLSRAIDAHVAAHPDDERVPRAFGYAPFVVGGHVGERRLITYQAWRLQRCLAHYEAVAVAPSRSLELRSLDGWLERLGVAEAFRALRPAVRLEREAGLPAAQDVLRPRAKL